jgi:CRP/FNR family cyclic AMP-dependent transcriptional regulator
MPHRSDITPASLLSALQSHLWFASCPPAFQMALIERARVRQIKAGDTLFARGEVQDGLYCVVAGALMLGSTNPIDGTQRLTLYVEPYQWIGEVALIDRLPRDQSAVADVDTTVLMISRANIEAWLVEHPENWRDLARLACGKLRLMLGAAEDRASLPFEQLLARRLLFTATQFGQTTQTVLRRRLRLPQEYLAKMLGVSRQTVNKALRVLERDGVLVLHYAEIEITDIEALVARAGDLDDAFKGAVAASAAPSSPHQR